MKAFTISLCCLNLLVASFCYGQSRSASSHNNTPNQPKKPSEFFPKENLMSIGVYYYPEQWPKEQWERDINTIAKLGFEFTHLAEFAWTYLEPEENKFDFQWLDEAVALASKAGLKIVMCTPTAAPPVWMSEKHPDIYLVDEYGRRREHGNRANQSVTNSHYQFYADRIVTALAKRYGKNPSVIGWQLDNEPSAPYDYSPSARYAFQLWLQKKYHTIDSLNKSWVGSFWSTRYQRFDQIIIPNTTVYFEDKLSPHAVLDFKRFTADAQAEFLNRQARLLRKYITPDQWITTNYTNVVYNADPRRTTSIDFPCYTMYPVSGRNPIGGNSFRTGSPYKLSEANDYYRPINGVTGVMELQPGQVNWAPINPQLLPGTVHLWLMQSFGGGCSFACTYRFRHPTGSSEMYHDGILGTDGITLSQGGKEFEQAIREMKLLRSAYDASQKLPAALAKRKTAFLWSHENLWDLENQPQTTAWNTWGLRNKYTAAIKSTGAPVDFIGEKDDFSSYPFIVASAYQLIDAELVSKWKRYVEEGGHLILTCRSGQKDKNGHFFEAPWSQPITALIGASIDYFDMLIPDINGKIKAGDNSYKWNSWAEILSPYDGTTVLSTYDDQFYKGKANSITRKLGKGTVTYIGAESVDGTLERQLVRSVYEAAGVSIENLPKGVILEWRDGFYVGVNYSSEAYSFPIPKESRILIGQNPVSPANAVIWK